MGKGSMRFMPKRRAGRLALLLALSMILGVAPKVQVFAFDGTSDGIAGKAVGTNGDTTTPTNTPTASEKANQLIKDIGACFNNKISSDDNETSGYSGNFIGLFNTLEETYVKYANQRSAKYGTDSNVIDIALGTEAANTNSYINEFADLNTLMKYAYNTVKLIKEAGAVKLISDENFDEFSKIMVGDGTDANKGISNSSKTGYLDLYYSQFNRMSGKDHFKNCLIDSSNVTKNKDLEEFLISNPYGYYVDLSTWTPDWGYSDADTTPTPTPSPDASYDPVYQIKQTTTKSATQYLRTYEQLEKIYVVETAYKNTLADVSDNISQYGYTDTVMKNIKSGLIDKIASYNAESVISSLYNKTEINSFITKYNNIKKFRDALYGLSFSAPETKSQILEAMYVYDLYNALTSDEKKLVWSVDKDKLDSVCGVDVLVNEVNTLINAIVWPTDDASFVTFCDAYDEAYNAYNSLVNTYSTGDIDTMISKKDTLLTDMTQVKNFITGVQTVLKTADSKMCDIYQTSILPLYNDYSNTKVLSSSNRSRIYNWNAFTTVYNDSKAAYELRARIDKLSTATVTDEETEIKAIRTVYDAMNSKAKAYFGDAYLTTLKTLEETLKAQNQNHANRVIELINKIGTVTDESGRKIVDAESAYAALTATEKTLVTNYSTLTAARSAYDSLRSDITGATITLSKTNYTYTRSSIKPTVYVNIDGNLLIKGTDYTVTYKNNKSVGTAYAIVTAIDGSKYKGTVTKTFTIKQKSIASGTISGVKLSYKYTGSKIKPTVKLKVGGYTLTKGTNYTVTYSNNKKKGTATITLKGKGNYKGTIKKKFKIVK